MKNVWQLQVTYYDSSSKKIRDVKDWLFSEKINAEKHWLNLYWETAWENFDTELNAEEFIKENLNKINELPSYDNMDYVISEEIIK